MQPAVISVFPKKQLRASLGLFQRESSLIVRGYYHAMLK